MKTNYIIFFIIILFSLVLDLLYVYTRIIKEKEKSKAEKDFISAMSHEIITPLNSLIELNFLMSQNLDNKELLKEYLNQSSSTAKYLFTLVNDVLDASDIHENRLNINENIFSFHDMIASIQTVETKHMLEKNIIFRVSADIICPKIINDKTYCDKILFNLLDNAYKFTPEGGNVDLVVTQSLIETYTVSTKIEVIDTGCGIEKELQSRIFDLSAQKLNTVSKNNHGTGLGMHISYLLAKMMGGSLSVESEIGKGSRFTFTFPSKIPDRSEEEFNETKEKDIKYEKEIKNTKKMNILIAEDSELNANILTAILEENDFTTKLAENGQEAVEIFEASAPGEFDFILMDVMMPVKNGFEAAKDIRRSSHPDAKTIKIYACTANTAEHDKIKALESGMNDFVNKPIDTEKLLSMLKK